MKQLTYAILATTLLLIGAGCATQESTQNGTTTSTQETTVKKKPPGVGTLEQAYTACEQQGFTVSLIFNQETNTSETYCVFPNKTACDIVAFATGNCSQELGATNFSPTKISSAAKTPSCNASSGPVCGTNGKTYPNECFALLQHVTIAKYAACPPGITPTPSTGTKTTSPSQSGSTKKDEPIGPAFEPQPIPPEPEPSNTAWLTILADAIQYEPVATPRATLEQCVYGNTLYYYYSGGCETCFSVLYSQYGEVTCYPNNNLNNSCPSIFSKQSRGPYCDVIWTDERK